MLDPIGSRLARMVVAVTQRPEAKPALTGTWLGHAVHPRSPTSPRVDGGLVPRPLRATRRRSCGPARDWPRAPGRRPRPHRLGEWLDTDAKERRSASFTPATNSAAVALYRCSYLARRRDRRLAAAVLGTLGGLVAIGDWYVGDHLTLSLIGQSGSRTTAFEELPDEWTPTLPTDQLPERRPTRVLAGTAEIVLVGTADRLFALADRCT